MVGVACRKLVKSIRLLVLSLADRRQTSSKLFTIPLYVCIVVVALYGKNTLSSVVFCEDSHSIMLGPNVSRFQFHPRHVVLFSPPGGRMEWYCGRY